MKYAVVFFLLFLFLKSIAQTEHLKEFYPENKLYKKLKVKAVIDSFMIDPANSRITEYDTSGRELCSYYLGSGCSPYIYLKSGDTLTKLKYYGELTQANIFSFEQFIYNSKGEILKHSLSNKSYTGEKAIYAKLDVFFYNSTGLFCKMEYTNHDYPKTVEANMVIAENDLKISSAIYYTYKKTNNGITIVARETIGSIDWRSTDTIVYDKMNHLVKRNSFSRRGTPGEVVHDNLNMIEEYHFKDFRIGTRQFYTYCLAIASDGYCLSPQQSEINAGEIWLNKQGLKEAEYSYYANGAKHLVSKYYYLFYE